MSLKLTKRSKITVLLLGFIACIGIIYLVVDHGENITGTPISNSLVPYDEPQPPNLKPLAPKPPASTPNSKWGGGGGGGGKYDDGLFGYQHLFVAEDAKLSDAQLHFSNDFFPLLNDIETRPVKNQVGIVNKGNSCYADSALQLLFRIPAIRKLVANLDIYIIASAAEMEALSSKLPEIALKMKREDREIGIKIAKGLNHMFHQLQTNTSGIPARFEYKNTRLCMPGNFAAYNQEDADEYITFVFGKLIELIPEAQKQYFYLKFKEFGPHRCELIPKLSKVKSEFVELIQLSLSVEGNDETSFIALLEKFFAFEDSVLNFDNGIPGIWSRKLRIISLPQYIPIHLKRLVMENHYLVKKSQVITAPEEIDFSPYVLDEAKKTIGSCKYRLNFYITHCGGARGGHYIATDYKSQTVFNDSEVYPYVSSADLTGSKDTSYFCLYERID